MNRIALALLAATALLFAACKKEYDVPPDTSTNDPMLPVTHTIEDFKALNGAYNFRIGGDTTLITEDIIISGVVTANDKSGNIYQHIFIEDSTGGLRVNINAFSLYNDYPVGRKIYIRCRGLMLGYNAGTPVLGNGIDERFEVQGITGSQIFNQIVKGPVGQPVPMDTVTLTEAVDFYSRYVNRLVTIKDVEFVDSNATYAQATGNTNREIRDCAGSKTLDIRTSPYASFFSARLPRGNGSITGVLTIFSSSFNGAASPQLTLRDTSDVKLTNPPCTSGPAQRVTIDSLRRRFASSGSVSLGPTEITGVVISNRLRENLDGRNLVLQQGNRGIVVRFSAQHSFNQGDSLVIDATSQSLSEFRGLLQVSSNSFQTAKAQRVATAKVVAPQTLTIAQIVGSAFETYESTLVRIVNATASGGTTYYQSSTPFGNRTLSDGTGNITLYTDGDASFASAPLPAGPRTWVGIIGQYDAAKQFSIRDTTDVQ